MAEHGLAALSRRLCAAGATTGAGAGSTRAGAGLRLRADTDQLEQVLINLLRNALESGGDAPVVLRACADGAMARIEVLDGGVGLPPSDNLFVPFFTTKPGGSGIGLVLSRQIVDAQGGSLELRPRSDAPGSGAKLWLPLAADGAV